MNDGTTTSKILSNKSGSVEFDTASTGQLSGSSTSGTSNNSPNIAAKDATTQTGNEPFTFGGESPESDRTAFILHQEVVQTPFKSEEESIVAESEGAISIGPDSEGTRYDAPNDGTEQKTVMEAPNKENEGLFSGNKPDIKDSSNGNNSSPSWWIRDAFNSGVIEQCTALTKTLVDNVIVNYADTCYCINCKKFVKVINL